MYECRWTEALDRSDHLKLLAEMWKLKANLLQSSIQQWKLNKSALEQSKHCLPRMPCCGGLLFNVSKSLKAPVKWQPAIISDPFHSVDLKYWWTLEIHEKISSNTRVYSVTAFHLLDVSRFLLIRRECEGESHETWQSYFTSKDTND